MKPVSLEVTMMKRIGELNAENARLKAEVERLTKAGDYLASHLEWEFGTDSSTAAWKAAKEGKQS
jgi:hypothetical protein